MHGYIYKLGVMIYPEGAVAKYSGGRNAMDRKNFPRMYTITWGFCISGYLLSVWFMRAYVLSQIDR